jgi:O-antigen ligase
MLLLLALFMAFLLGAVAALFGGVSALFLFSPFLVLLLLLADYRVGVIALMVIIVFQHTPFLPSFTGFNIVNYIVAGTLGIVMFGKLFGKKLPITRLPGYFWWGYIIPILLAGFMGTRHLSEIPDSAMEAIGHSYDSVRSYLSGVTIKPFFLVILAWLIGTASINSNNPRLFLIPFSISFALPPLAIVVFVLAFGVDLKLLSNQYGREILGTLGIHANELGFLLSTGIVMFLFVYPTLETLRGKIFLTILLALASGALMLTFSRGGYLIFFIGLLLFLASRKKAVYVLSGLSIMALVTLILPEAFWERITTGVDDVPSSLSAQGTDALTAGRVWLWVQLWPSFLDSPIWGSGLDSTTWSDAVKNGIFTYTHPHNLYLRILLDMGIIGFGLLTYWFVKLMRDLRKVVNNEAVPPQYRSLAMGLRAALWGMLAAGVSNGHFTPHSELAYIWIAIGLLLPYFASAEQKPGIRATPENKHSPSLQ